MADTLERIYTLNQFAETKQIFLKAKSSLKIPSKETYNSLPDDIKSQYKNYTDYKNKIVASNAVTKKAIEDKLEARKVLCSTEENFTTEEKTQYSNEFQSAIEVKNANEISR